MFLSYLLFLHVGIAITANPPLINTPNGAVIGNYIILENEKVIHYYLGVPYASPPLLNNRFEAPKPFPQWTGIWNATSYTRPCIQYNFMIRSVIGDEDCLYLNIFSTSDLYQNVTEGLNDVIVWFHGGSFMQGTGNYIIPEYILNYHDLVVVSVNYRVGVFGFFSTGDDIVPGNNGLKDQVLALQWVQENIIHFGGNPNSITIAGISAGATSVHFHTLSSMSEGLFHKAIMSSGSALQPWLFLGDTAVTSGKHIARSLGCDTEDSAPMIECLKQRPAPLIASTYESLLVWRNLGPMFGPVVEPPGENRFLTEYPITIMRSKKNKRIPYLISVTKDEGYVGLYDFVNNAAVLGELDNRFTEIAPHMLFYFHKIPPDQQNRLGNKIRETFFQNQSIVSEKNFPKLVKFLGDRLITAYVEYAITEHARQNFGPIYYMKFNYHGQYSTIDPFKSNASISGVSHGDDIFYINKNLFHKNDLTTEEDLQMSEILTTIWASFANTGEPAIGFDWLPVSNVSLRKGLRHLKINSIYDIGVEYDKIVDAFDFWNTTLNEFPAVDVENKILDESSENVKVLHSDEL